MFTVRPDGGYTMYHDGVPVAVVVRVGDLWYAAVPGFGTTKGLPTRRALAAEIKVAFSLERKN